MTSLRRLGLEPAIEAFQQDHATHETVFVIMRFANHLLLNTLLAIIREELRELGIKAIRGDDKPYAQTVWSNAEIYMLGADAGIAIFDNVTVGGHPPTGFNPNVSIEAGYMMGLDKPVLLLKDQYLERMPSDFDGVIYTKFDPDNPESVRKDVRKWAEGVFG